MMACYESCVETGKRCSLVRSRIYCSSCGRVKPHYTFVPEHTVKQTHAEPIQPVAKEEKEQRIERQEEFVPRQEEWVPFLYYRECRCKETWWEWLLSFLGFGSKLPECCQRVPVTAWDSGKVARAAITSKVQQVIQHFGGRGKPQVRRNSQINLQEVVKEGDKPATDTRASEKHHQDPHIDRLSYVDSSSTVSDFDAPLEFKGVPKKRKRKVKKIKSSYSSSLRDAPSGHYRRNTRLLSAFAELKARSKPPPSNSSSDNSITTDRSTAGSGLFNPFRNRSFVRACSSPRRYKEVYCPKLPCIVYRKSRSKSPLRRCKEASDSENPKVRIQAQQKGNPSKVGAVCKHQQPLGKCPQPLDKCPQPLGKCPPPANKSPSSARPCHHKCDYRVIKSRSMPCTSCFDSSKPFRSRFCRCDPELPCGGPKLPCRSQSFHSTLMRSPSPLAVVMPTSSPCCRPCVVSTGRPRCRRFRCSCPLECTTRRTRSCSRPCFCPVKSPYCSPSSVCKSGREKPPLPYVDKQNPCNLDCCHLGSKPPIRMCPPCCTKPCCMPCPRKFTVFPYCPRVDATSKRYLSIPPCTMRAACPCPTGGPCSCPKAKHFPLPCCPYSPSPTCRVACSTPSAMSYIKSKQNDAICQRLLSKYGFSPPLCLTCPPPCYGAAAEGICDNLAPSCTSNFYSCNTSGSGGCRSCLQ